MFSLLKAGISLLFGGGNQETKGISKAMTVAKGIGGFIDEQNFTEQERVEANAKSLNLTLEAVKLTRDENSVRSVTRRILAWSIMGSLLLSFWIALIRYLIFETDPKDIIAIVEAFSLGNLALAVGSFYFMASLIRK